MEEEEEEISFEEQLKLEELERKKREGTLTKTDPDGTVFEWDDNKKAWFPKVSIKISAEVMRKYQNNFSFCDTTKVV